MKTAHASMRQLLLTAKATKKFPPLAQIRSVVDRWLRVKSLSQDEHNKMACRLVEALEKLTAN